MTKPARPIADHPFHGRTISELLFIARDASAAAKSFQGWNDVAECKYLDQVNDACTVLYYRANLQTYAETR